MCRRDRKWTRGKHPVREKRRSNQSGGGRYAGNDSAVRQTYSGMIAGDVDQRAGGDSSPRATNSAGTQIHRLDRVWHSTHLFPTSLQPSTHPQFPEAVTPSPRPVQTSCCCTEGPKPLKRSPEPVHDFYRKLRYRKLHATEEIELFTSKGGKSGMR